MIITMGKRKFFFCLTLRQIANAFHIFPRAMYELQQLSKEASEGIFLYNFYFKKLVIITIRLTRITQFLSKLILSVLDISPDLVSMKSLVLADLNWPCHRDERKFIIQAFDWSWHLVQQSYELISQIKDVNSNRRHR